MCNCTTSPLRSPAGRRSITSRAGCGSWKPEVTRTQEDALLRAVARWDGTAFPRTGALAWRWLSGRAPLPEHASRAEQTEAAYCAEVVAVTMEAMGLLESGRPSNWYDPGRFWSGDDLPLRAGWSYGEEIPVRVGGR